MTQLFIRLAQNNLAPIYGNWPALIREIANSFVFVSFQNQWQTNKGKCGVCGDPWQGPYENEAGGKFAQGIITRHYRTGQVVDVTVQVTAHHKGWFEFRLCKNNDVHRAITHRCLNRHMLRLADGSRSTRYSLPQDSCAGSYVVKVHLPRGLSCAQCVLQWKYHAGKRERFMVLDMEIHGLK